MTCCKCRFVVEGGAVEGPIGPHPCSQFEIVFFRPATTEFIEWLQVAVCLSLVPLSAMRCVLLRLDKHVLS